MDDGSGIPPTHPLCPLLLGMGWFPDQPGGLNRYLKSLHAALEADGQEPSAVVIGPALDAPPSVRAVSDHGEPLAGRIASYAIAARSAARGSGMVDAHFALYAVAPVVLGAIRGRPFVVHFQGPWADESLAVGDTPWIASAKRLIERAVYRRADLLITLSVAFKQILVEDYGVRPWRIDCIAPGVDLDRFRPGNRLAARSALGIPPGAWVAVTVRRLVPRMGLDTLLAAWPKVLHDHPEAVLLICGSGPEQRALESHAVDLGLAESVRFLGHIADDDLVAAYRSADVSIVPTTKLEGFGLITLESLACGTPVVVTDVAGLADVPRRLDPTLVVPASDPVALAERLTRALEGSAPLPSGETCRRFAESYSWDEVARHHIDRYRRLAAGDERQRALRVVFLDHVAELSGGELALLRLLPALTEVDVHVILAENGALVDRLLQAGISVEVLPMRESTRRLRRGQVRPGFLPVRSVFDTLVHVAVLARRLRALRPDIVHTNSLKAAVYGGLAARLSGKRLVWHIRDRIAPDYLPTAAVRVIRALARRLPHGVIANSETTMATLGRQRQGGAQVRAVVASPADLAPDDDAVDQSAKALRVVMVGRLDRWKGQHVFLRAFAMALRGQGARAVIVGGPLFGQEEYEAGLKGLVGQLGIDGQVDFLGHRDDVLAILRSCQVLVHASVIAEPFGQVCVEGMAAGLAVVAADAGGPAEVITHGHDGLLVAPGDVDGLAAALKRLASDSGLRSRLGSAGRRSSRDYRPDAIAARTMTVYRAVTDTEPA